MSDDFDPDAYIAAHYDAQAIVLPAAQMIDDLSFGFESLDPQTNARRAQFLEQQLALPAGERDERTTAFLDQGEEYEEIARDLVDLGGDLEAFVSREYPESSTEIAQGISQATANWQTSAPPSGTGLDQASDAAGPTIDTDAPGSGDLDAEGIAPGVGTDHERDFPSEESRVVVDVDHHVQQSAALAARAGLLLGMPLRGARAVAGGATSLGDSLTPTSPLARRALQLTTDAAVIAASDMEHHPLINPTRGPGMHR